MRGGYVLFLLVAALGARADAATLAHYKVAEHGRAWVDEISGERTPVTGLASERPGPTGIALQFDGLSTTVTPKSISQLTESGRPWSVTCWLKLDALPWNEAPIIDQATASGRLFFGVDAW